MGFNKRITASFLAMAGLVVAMGLASWISLGKLESVLETAIRSSGRRIVALGQVNTALADMRAAQHALILYFSINDLAAVEQHKHRFQEAAERAGTRIGEVQRATGTGEGLGRADSLSRGVDIWKSHYREMIRLCAEQKCADGLAIASNRINPLAEQLRRTASELEQVAAGLQASEEMRGQRQVTIARGVILVLVVLSSIACAAILLSVRKVNVTLRQVARDVTEGSEQVASAAAQVSSASESLAQGASEQAASLEETSAASQEIGSMTQKNADNARAAADLMRETTRIVATVDQAIGEMAKSMAEINGSSDKISKIIKVIDEIAFQTNILALNAAVEAARAGEAGMGFAVVADEVRNLAQRSAQAAKDTAALIDESIRKSNEGKAKLEQVTRAMAANTEIAGKVKVLVDEVNVGSQEQARAIEQVSTSVAQMEQVTQKTAAHAEESASSSRQMHALALAMRAAVERLRSVVGGETISAPLGAGSLRRPAARSQAATSGLFALKKAVGAGNPEPPAMKPQEVAAPRASFPLDDDFKEF